jgi:arylsulfatase A
MARTDLILVALFAACVTAPIAAAAGKPSARAATPSFLFLLGDDIGWADLNFPNNGTAHTPNLRAWANKPGSIYLQDFHTGGTVCSPTRATVLTGRNHFRDCVNYVYGCSDMTECVPDFEFAPQRTFTIGDAVRSANKGYKSFFGGKWHLCVSPSDALLASQSGPPLTLRFLSPQGILLQ